MANIICWICGSNLTCSVYDGTKLLDEYGSKPCLECWQEDDALEEEENDDEFR